jgi:hypothetical protein
MEIPDLLRIPLKAGFLILMLGIIVVVGGGLLILAYGFFGIVGAILLVLIIIYITYLLNGHSIHSTTHVEAKNYTDDDEEDYIEDYVSDDDLDLPTDVPNDYLYRSSTEKYSDSEYVHKIENSIYGGSISGYGSTPDEARDAARRQYDHYRDEDRKRRKEEWLQKMKQKKNFEKLQRHIKELEK